MLLVVLNISKSTHVTNKNVCAGIFSVSIKIAARRIRLAGHCQNVTYVDVLKKDAGVQSTNELAGFMENWDDDGLSEDDLESKIPSCNPSEQHLTHAEASVCFLVRRMG